MATRVDTLQLKDAIFRKIGLEKATNYFIQLERFLNLKLNKIEFDMSCIRIIGRENLYLHNILIRAIIRNARIPGKEARQAEALNVKVTNCVKKTHLQPQPKSSLSKDRKCKERRSPLGPLGKSPSLSYEETDEEVEQSAHWWKSVTAPVGVSHNMGGDRRGRLRSNNLCFPETCQSRVELPDTNSLGRRLRRKLGEDGVGISRDGANLLNRSLDVYLKKIISQCVGVAGSRSGDPFNGERASGFIEISPGQYVETPRQQTCVSLLDFRVAMESNPSVLGEGWPLHLEKIRNYPFQ